MSAEYPKEYKYTREHEWVALAGAAATVGVTDFAQSELGEIVFVELPAIGKTLKAGDTLCVVESTKAASDVYAPVGGKVIEVNSALQKQPNLVNTSPHKEGWLVKLGDVRGADAAQLLSAADYSAHAAGKH